VAVLVAEPFARGLVYLCAIRPRDAAEDAPLAWIALDAAGEAIDDEVAVREAASLVALCEVAEEAAAALRAAAIGEAARRALELAPADAEGLREPLEAIAAAAAALERLSGGVRVARSAYLDELGDQARALAAGFDALRPEAEELSGHLRGVPGEEGEPLALAVWEVIGRITESGPPGRFAEAIGGAAGAVDALAGDVVGALRVE
jgi:hypothetical protein